MFLLPATIRTRFFLLACTLLLCTETVCAALKPASAKLPIGSPDILNAGGALIIVVLAIIVLGVVYARTQGLRSGAEGVINIVATQAIGPKERIAIIEVANTQLLVGMTATSVQTLHVFDEPVSFVSAPKTGFAEKLKMFRQGSAS